MRDVTIANSVRAESDHMIRSPIDAFGVDLRPYRFIG